MWKIIFAEIKYFRILFFSILTTTPVVAYIAVHSDRIDLPAGIPFFWTLMILTMYWIQFRHKELRDRHHAPLPLSIVELAFSRIGVLCFFGLTLCGGYLISQWIISSGRIDHIASCLVPTGMLLSGYAIYFILRDLLLNFLRNNRFFTITKERSKSILIIIALMINLTGIATFYLIKERLLNIDGFVTFIVENPLFTTPQGNGQFVFIAFFLCGLTILSFIRRPFYTE